MWFRFNHQCLMFLILFFVWSFQFVLISLNFNKHKMPLEWRMSIFSDGFTSALSSVTQSNSNRLVLSKPNWICERFNVFCTSCELHKVFSGYFTMIFGFFFVSHLIKRQLSEHFTHFPWFHTESVGAKVLKNKNVLQFLLLLYQGILIKNNFSLDLSRWIGNRLFLPFYGFRRMDFEMLSPITSTYGKLLQHPLRWYIL